MSCSDCYYLFFFIRCHPDRTRDIQAMTFLQSSPSEREVHGGLFRDVNSNSDRCFLCATCWRRLSLSSRSLKSMCWWTEGCTVLRNATVNSTLCIKRWDFVEFPQIQSSFDELRHWERLPLWSLCGYIRNRLLKFLDVFAERYLNDN